MTSTGGAHYAGTVFKATPSGTVTILHSFNTTIDGENPSGSLVQGSDGNFYGMTRFGGANGAGTVFEITPSGTETILHSFANNSTDGGYPAGSLILGSDGNFYGMAGSGGANGDGIIFKITPTGSETVLWSFAGSNGSTPYGDLTIGPDGTLYGVTSAGGANGHGVVFQFN
jgi:uncharacterized repeat protein (TIGR03803 family)